jgi:hypothetical protein
VKCNTLKISDLDENVEGVAVCWFLKGENNVSAEMQAINEHFPLM